MNYSIRNLCLFLVSVFVFVACAPTYSPYIYDQTGEMKKQAIALMDKAESPYSKYSEKVELLMSDIESLSTQDKLRKNNKIKIKQWELLKDPEGHLLYGFFNKWQKDTTLNETFIDLERKLVSESFDLMRETEKQRLNNRANIKY